MGSQASSQIPNILGGTVAEIRKSAAVPVDNANRMLPVFVPAFIP
jgi:hypothetical protein